MRDFRRIDVWGKAHQLTLSVYQATKMFPKHELFGLTSQVRRSAASIPANIAEGCGRGSVPELTRFMRISMGSATELEYHLLLGHDLCLLSENEYQQLNAALYEVKCMLAKYIQRLEAEG